MFELTDIDKLVSTGEHHGYVPALAEDQDQPVGLWEFHLNPAGEVCAAYFTAVPCCETGRCPHWTVIDRWEPLNTQSLLHCPTCGVEGRVSDGHWVDAQK
jgi:hypothetical protein